MPKIITGNAANFASTVTVPTGDDDLDEHAQDIEHIAQTLLNNTASLESRTGKLGAANVWTGDATFSNPVRANNTLIVDRPAGTDPAIYIDRAPGTHVEMIAMRAGNESNNRVRMYASGDQASPGAFFITVNARYNGTAWEQVDPTRKSCALIMRDGDMRVVSKGAGTAPWGWQESTLSAFDSEILAEVFRAARTLVTANTDADNTNGYRYIDPVTRWSPIPLGSIWGTIAYNTNGHVLLTNASVPYRAAYIPIRIAPYCSFRSVRVRFYQLQPGTPADEFQLLKRNGTSGWTGVGGAETHAEFISGGLVTATLHSSTYQKVLDGEEYCYRWRSTSGALEAVDNRIVGTEVEWLDVGPNNRVG